MWARFLCWLLEHVPPPDDPDRRDVVCQRCGRLFDQRTQGERGADEQQYGM